MTTDPDALTEAEWEPIDGAWMAEDVDALRTALDHILSARAAALRADIARDIEALRVTTVTNQQDDLVDAAARIALGGTDA